MNVVLNFASMLPRDMEILGTDEDLDRETSKSTQNNMTVIPQQSVIPTPGKSIRGDKISIDNSRLNLIPKIMISISYREPEVIDSFNDLSKRLISEQYNSDTYQHKVNTGESSHCKANFELDTFTDSTNHPLHQDCQSTNLTKTECPRLTCSKSCTNFPGVSDSRRSGPGVQRTGHTPSWVNEGASNGRLPFGIKLLLVWVVMVNLALGGGHTTDRSSLAVLSSYWSPCREMIPSSSSRHIYVRHPQICSVFFVCHRRRSWRLSCDRPNTIFSKSRQVCVWEGSKFDDCPYENKVHRFWPGLHVSGSTSKSELNDSHSIEKKVHRKGTIGEYFEIKSGEPFDNKYSGGKHNKIDSIFSTLKVRHLASKHIVNKTLTNMKYILKFRQGQNITTDEKARNIHKNRTRDNRKSEKGLTSNIIIINEQNRSYSGTEDNKNTNNMESSARKHSTQRKDISHHQQAMNIEPLRGNNKTGLIVRTSSDTQTNSKHPDSGDHCLSDSECRTRNDDDGNSPTRDISKEIKVEENGDKPHHATAGITGLWWINQKKKGGQRKTVIEQDRFTHGRRHNSRMQSPQARDADSDVSHQRKELTPTPEQSPEKFRGRQWVSRTIQNDEQLRKRRRFFGGGYEIAMLDVRTVSPRDYQRTLPPFPIEENRYSKEPLSPYNSRRTIPGKTTILQRLKSDVPDNRQLLNEFLRRLKTTSSEKRTFRPDSYSTTEWRIKEIPGTHRKKHHLDSTNRHQNSRTAKKNFNPQGRGTTSGQERNVQIRHSRRTQSNQNRNSILRPLQWQVRNTHIDQITYREPPGLRRNRAERKSVTKSRQRSGYSLQEKRKSRPPHQWPDNRYIQGLAPKLLPQRHRTDRAKDDSRPEKTHHPLPVPVRPQRPRGNVKAKKKPWYLKTDRKARREKNRSHRHKKLNGSLPETQERESYVERYVKWKEQLERQKFDRRRHVKRVNHIPPPSLYQQHSKRQHQHQQQLQKRQHQQRPDESRQSLKWYERKPSNRYPTYYYQDSILNPNDLKVDIWDRLERPKKRHFWDKRVPSWTHPTRPKNRNEVDRENSNRWQRDDQSYPEANWRDEHRRPTITTALPDITRVPHTTHIRRTTLSYQEGDDDDDDDDHEVDDNETVPYYRSGFIERCGILARPLIVGGRKSRPGQWPWQASLQIVTSTTPWHRCGAVLVHESWLLTAAHCMEGPFYGDIRNWRVVLADDDLEVQSGDEIYRNVVRIVSHPGYVRVNNFPNDLALLQMDRPVDVTSGEVQTACLPDSTLPLTAGTQCWISGWGETRGSGGKDNTMNEVPVDVVDLGQCQAMWNRVDIEVLDSQVCLGTGEIGACYGDSGGPLMCEQNGRFYVTGVMSWLIKNCSAHDFPNVFTRLPPYMDWVNEQLDFYQGELDS